MMLRAILGIILIISVIYDISYGQKTTPVIIDIKPQPVPEVSSVFKFEAVEPVSTQYSGNSLYSRVMNRLETPFTDGSRATQAHETVHGINNKFRNMYFYKLLKSNKDKANDAMALFYLPGNIFYSFRPHANKNQIAEKIPKSLQTSKYELYITNPQKINQGSEDVLDEWMAYIVDAEVAIEDAKNGIKQGNEIGGGMGVLELGIFTAGVCLADTNIDPELKTFLKFMFNRADKVFREARRVLPFEPQETLLQKLRKEKDAEEIRNLLQNDFSGAFLRD